MLVPSTRPTPPRRNGQRRADDVNPIRELHETVVIQRLFAAGLGLNALAADLAPSAAAEQRDLIATELNNAVNDLRLAAIRTITTATDTITSSA